MFKNIRIVLINTSHPGNVGAAARAMKNMGLSRLYLVQPKDFPSSQAYSRAAGADDVLGHAVVTSSLDEALGECRFIVGASARTRAIQWPQIDARACAERVVDECSSGDVALLFGREQSGLTNEELERCHYLVNIPSNPEYSSLNIAAAVQVLCYEVRMAMLINDEDRSIVDKRLDEEDKPAGHEQIQRLFEHMSQSLDDIGFFGTTNPELIMRRLRALYNRARPSQREVKILRGILSASQGGKSARKNN